MSRIKNLIRRVLYIIPGVARLHRFLRIVLPVIWPVIKLRMKYPKAVFLLLTPTHGNLGDQAIAEAEIALLKKHGIQYIEIPDKYFYNLAEQGWLKIFNGRVLCLQGGGYMGTLWVWVEKQFRKLIAANPKSKIFCFPNTVYYGSSQEDQEELQKSVEIYNAHPSLRICMREKISFDYAKKIYSSVVLYPDVVLSLNKEIREAQRSGCLLCLRNDVEKTMSEKEEKQLLEEVKKLFCTNYQLSDMYHDIRVEPESRTAILEQKFERFRRAELVITDRLHGMIFSAITATPCIVLNSKSHKLKGCYEWIRHLPYIKFADKPEDIPAIYSAMDKADCHYDSSPFEHYFDEMMSEVKALAN